MGEKIIFETLVGSHMWRMQHAGSDEDHFVCYAASTRDILSGKAHYNSHFSHGNKIDRTSHEVGVVVNQLLKGNVNFLWGVMSPVVIKTSSWHKELKEIVKRNLSKNYYNSIHGLAMHNFRKYIESGKDTSVKRCNTIGRTLVFGMKLLAGAIRFEPVGKMVEGKPSSLTPNDIKKMIGELEMCYKGSTLPERPKEKEFREWLYRLRLSASNLREV